MRRPNNCSNYLLYLHSWHLWALCRVFYSSFRNMATFPKLQEKILAATDPQKAGINLTVELAAQPPHLGPLARKLYSMYYKSFYFYYIPTWRVISTRMIAIFLFTRHQKQHHVPYSLAISINGTFLLIHGIASTLWAFQYVFLIIYFRYFLFLVIFSCPIETVPYLRNFSFQKFGFPSIFIFLYFHLI